MKTEFQKKTELFISNVQSVKSEFFWHNIMSKRLAAMIYTIENKALDGAAIKDSRNLIDQNTGFISNFRGNMALCVAAMLSMRENKEELFSHTKNVYKILKDTGFWGSDYLVVAAYQIAANSEPCNHSRVIERSKAFYDGMKTNAFFRTGQDDYIFAAMLGLSNIDIDAGVAGIDKLYRRFKSEFWSGNSVQSLAQILVLSGEKESAEKVLTLRDTLRKRQIKLDKTYTLPSIGILALLPVDIAEIANDIDEVKSYLRLQKGFNAFSVTKQELFLYSASLTASVYADEIKNGIITASISTSITSIIIAEQMAMIAAMAAASSAASASAST